MTVKARRWTSIALATAIAVATMGTATADAAKKKRGCVPAKSVEAILDDSGSMSGTDPDKLRTDLLDAFAGINSGRIFGGVEFGSSANTLWPPGLLPGVIPAMQASFGLVDADNGGTDYDEGFALGNAQNPKANARLFLSDGLASPPTQHLNPKVRTYVIGLGEDLLSDPSAQQLLTSIAQQTGGQYYPVFLAEQVQPVAADITAAISCGLRPITFNDLFQTVGQVVVHTFQAVGPKATILTTWPTDGVVLTPDVQGAQIAKVRGVRSGGAKFSAIRLKGLKRKKRVTISIAATALGSDTVGTTQVIRSKKKKKKKKRR